MTEYRKVLPDETILKFGLIPHLSSQTFYYGLAVYECKIDGYKFIIHNTNEDDSESPYFLHEKGLWELIAYSNGVGTNRRIPDDAFDEMFEMSVKEMIKEINEFKNKSR